jgi:hypothetical protein
VPNIVKNRIRIQLCEQYEPSELAEWLRPLYNVYKDRVTTRDMLLPTPPDEWMVIPFQIYPCSKSEETSEDAGTRPSCAARFAAYPDIGDTVVVRAEFDDFSNIFSMMSWEHRIPMSEVAIVSTF